MLARTFLCGIVPGKVASFEEQWWQTTVLSNLIDESRLEELHGNPTVCHASTPTPNMVVVLSVFRVVGRNDGTTFQDCP